MIRVHQRLLAFLLISLVTTAAADEKKGDKDYVPQPGKFPPPKTATYIAGELVIVDPINRRAGLRLDGVGDDGLYHVAPIHYFAMLPYGSIWYHGAPAELRDIPIGTHVHGYFYLPPKGEESTIRPAPKSLEKYVPKYNHAISLEDDFSLYQRRGQAWKVVSVDLGKRTLNVELVASESKGSPPARHDYGGYKLAFENPRTGFVRQAANSPDGLTGKYTFEFDQATRVWKDRVPVDLKEIAPGQNVQVNLTWDPGWRDKEYCLQDIWLDQASCVSATELQRRRHDRYQRYHWLPGWIEHVEHQDIGGGIVTITLFDGMDPSLYAEFKEKQNQGYGVAVSEKTLRTWWHNNDKKYGKIVEWKQIENPPPGHSGYQMRLRFKELLNGYRPGYIVRVQCRDWGYFRLPAEERIRRHKRSSDEPDLMSP